MSKKRTASSNRWLAEHESDIYVQKARAMGYRSRAVFKLEEIQQKDRILKPGQLVVDLGAAPGGWSEFARPLLGPKGRLIALDILPMEAIPGVDIILGDFREESVLRELEAMVGQHAVDLVFTDMAPNISGIDTADQAASIHLCELALEFAREHLKPAGVFVAKLFQGEGSEAYLRTVRQAFGTVVIRKPKASRPRSREVYLVAKSLKEPKTR